MRRAFGLPTGPRLMVLVIAAATLAACAPRTAAPDTTVIVLRHAEKESGSRDPDLSMDGRARANALAAILEQTTLSAVFASEYRRTQQTVAPAAQQAGVPVTVVPAGEISSLAGQILRDYAGQVVVVSGHSNTVPDLLRELGVGSEVVIDENDYRNLFVVTVRPDGTATVLPLQFSE